jgi:predicted rRNA methylase YqxC with S4 and FtsJ domains
VAVEAVEVPTSQLSNRLRREQRIKVMAEQRAFKITVAVVEAVLVLQEVF